MEKQTVKLFASLQNAFFYYFQTRTNIHSNCSSVPRDKKIFFRIAAQSAFTCSKLTIETLEQGVKYVQS